MGFDMKWVDALMKCVSKVSYSVVINGHIREKIFPTRGLRQGDPLNPFLFLLCGEGLSSLLRLAMNSRLFKGVNVSRSEPQFERTRALPGVAEFGGQEEKGILSKLEGLTPKTY
ncbi:hypothetical protein PVK06_005800 [Gossypium arboreum]|uniref:Reverse transcriptase domain-containing protein n=1 Tax=Gossypium arboreum TaxID=29729 RepID=A0ABR0QVH8_GOSAR|nr:hypothetical protein PVK06_005800 [Gossypium arboreum]